MPIEIHKRASLYDGRVTPPHGTGTPWRSLSPMPADDLITALLEQGCHQTDIGDAFHEADPYWAAEGPAE